MAVVISVASLTLIKYHFHTCLGLVVSADISPHFTGEIKIRTNERYRGRWKEISSACLAKSSRNSTSVDDETRSSR